MMRICGLLLLAAGLAAAQGEAPPIKTATLHQAAVPAQPARAEQALPRVTRATVVGLEQLFDGKVRKASVADPMELMSSAQGVYVDGFGLVITAQVDLISTPSLSPFRLKVSKSDVERVRARKTDHLPLLRQIMQQTMLEAAAAVPTLPANECIVVAVSLFRFNWEDATGLPAQIVMQAPRQRLLDHAAQTAIQVQEF